MCSVREDVINSVYVMSYSKDVRTQLTQISGGFQPLHVYSYWSTSVNQSVNQRKLNAIICKLRIQIDDETTGNIQLRRFETWKPKGLRSKRDCSRTHFVLLVYLAHVLTVKVS